jgi:titin
VSTSVTTSTGTTIRGKLNSRPGKTFVIQFFSSPAADPSGHGEGKTFLGQKRVKPSRKGKSAFSFITILPPGESVVTATATNRVTGDTSEFSEAVGAT